MTAGKAKRVLIVEDEFLVAMELEFMLEELGHRVIKVVTGLIEAIGIAQTADIDFAVLDINLGGAKSFPVAEVLRGRGIPFVFASGYGSDGLVASYRHERALRKPYERRELKRTIAEIFVADGY